MYFFLCHNGAAVYSNFKFRNFTEFLVPNFGKFTTEKINITAENLPDLLPYILVNWLKNTKDSYSQFTRLTKWKQSLLEVPCQAEKAWVKGCLSEINLNVCETISLYFKTF